jgi:hypothetical protein
VARTARFPQHQAARQPAQARAGPAVDGAEQFLARGPAELAQVHVHRGQRRPAGGRDDLPVVEADQRDQVLKGGPEYTVFAKETQTARSRTTEYGANYPKVSQAIWTAIQAAITGTSSVSSALQTAQGTISGVQQVSGG